jgi:hypothetical protein
LAAFQARIVCENPPSTLVTGGSVVLRFLIKNMSPVEWPATGNNAVTLQNRWWNQRGVILADRDASQWIPFDVEPDDTVGLVLKVTAPTEHGDYVIEVDLAQKNIAWFSERGSTAWRRRVKVVAND